MMAKNGQRLGELLLEADVITKRQLAKACQKQIKGDTSNGLPIDEGSYQWPSVCPVCPRACMHGAPSKWVRMEIIGEDDYGISGTAHIELISESGDTWIISGDGEGIFYNPYSETNMEGRIEFTNLKVEKDTANTPYSDYGGH